MRRRRRTSRTARLAATMIFAGLLVTGPAGYAQGPEYVRELISYADTPERVVAATETTAFVASSDSAEGRGRVHYYRLAGSGPTQSWEWRDVQASPEVGTRFGASLAVEGDLLVVGAPANLNGSPESAGSVYVYRIGDRLTQIAHLTPPDAAIGQAFGVSVAIDGGVIVVGSPQAQNDYGTAIGGVYVFTPAQLPGAWTFRAKILDPGVAGGRFSGAFGHDVAISGSLIAVGAPATAVGSNIGAGAVSVLRLSGSSLTEIWRTTGSSTSDLLGISVDILGNRLLFGVPGQNKAEIYNRIGFPTDTFVRDTTLTPWTVMERFGWSVDLWGSKALVGVPGNGRGGNLSGDAVGFRLRGGTWERYFFPNCCLISYSETGQSVALAGDRTVFLSWRGQGNVAGKAFAGGAKIFTDRDFSAPTIQLTNPLPPANTKNTSVTLRFEAHDNVTADQDLITECSVNGGAWTPCTSPHTFNGLPERTNTLTARVRDESGNTASASTKVVVDLTPPGIYGVRETPVNEHGWNNGSVTVRWVCWDPKSPFGDKGSGIVECDPMEWVSSEGKGQTITGTARDYAGNTTTTTFGPFDIDKTPPNLTVNKSAANAYGWHRARVWTTYVCSDSLSGVLTCPASEMFNHGVTTVQRETTDKAGNKRTVSHTVNVDTVPPVAQFTGISPAPNQYGWNRSPVTLAWTCNDALSGPLTPSGQKTVNDTGPADAEISMICQDRAMNSSRITRPVRIDVDRPWVYMDEPPAVINGHTLTGESGDGESRINHVYVDAVPVYYGSMIEGPPHRLYQACHPDCAEGKWEISTDSLPQGTYKLHAWSVDRAGNRSYVWVPFSFVVKA